jgi:cytochrome P450
MRADFFTRHRRFLGQGLLTSEGELHRWQRKQVQPALSRAKVASLIPGFAADAQHVSAQWRDGQSVNIVAELRRMTLRSAARHVLGIESEAEAEDLCRLAGRSHYRRVRQVHARFPLPDWLPTSSRAKYDRVNEAMHTLVLGLIDRRRTSGGEPGDLVGMLLKAPGQDGKPMTDSQIRDEVCTLFLAAVDGIARTLAWALWTVAQRSDLAARLRAEIDTAGATCEAPASNPAAMPFSAAVFSEALRLYPHGWLLARQARETDTVPTGAAIPRGAQVFISPLAIHRNPRYFADPERFDPDRFLGEGPRPWPLHAYLPFGHGPHNCIGEGYARTQATAVLATLLPRHSFALVPGQTIRFETPNGNAMQPTGDCILLRVARR